MEKVFRIIQRQHVVQFTFMGIANILPKYPIFDRLRVFPIRLSGVSIGKLTTIRSYVDLRGTDKISIGNKVFINGGVRIAAAQKVTIGDNVLIGPGAQIETNNHSLTQEPDGTRLVKGKEVVIEDGVWIGAKSLILPGVTVRKGSVIAAGAVVTKNVPENVLVAGVPAKIIKSLN